jgi:NADPH:quinone reductase-like Zn-dependent oxidoreductase
MNPNPNADSDPKMLKIEVSEFGAPEVLRPVEVDSLEAEEGAVVIRSKAIGVNFADVWSRLGAGGEPPLTPGIEVAGVVATSGSPRFAAGDPVVGTPYFTRGTYAQEVSVPAELLFPLPDGVEFQVAAALPLNYLTAYAAVVERARPRNGERVLVTSGAGGVGLAVVDLAKDAGAHVFATASPAKHDFLRRRGVAGVVDSRSPTLVADVMAMTGGGVDVVVDGVGADHFRQGLDCLRYGGRVVAYGFTSGVESKTDPPEDPEVTLGRQNLPLLDLFDKARSFMTADAGPGPAQEAEWLGRLFDWLRVGRIAPRIDRVFPLREAAAAHHYLQDRKNVGKVLLDPIDA